MSLLNYINTDFTTEKERKNNALKISKDYFGIEEMGRVGTPIISFNDNLGLEIIEKQILNQNISSDIFHTVFFEINEILKSRFIEFAKTIQPDEEILYLYSQ